MKKHNFVSCSDTPAHVVLARAAHQSLSKHLEICMNHNEILMDYESHFVLRHFASVSLQRLCHFFAPAEILMRRFDSFLLNVISVDLRKVIFSHCIVVRVTGRVNFCPTNYTRHYIAHNIILV